MLLKNDKYWIWAGIALLLAFSLYPLTKLFIVTGDDLEYFVHSSPELWFSHAKVYAEGTGRFYFLLVKWIYHVPYLIDSPIYYYCCAIIPIITSFVLLFSLVQKMTRSHSVAQIFALIAVSLFGIYGEYSIFSAYPLYFTLSINILFMAFHLLLAYLRSYKRYFLWLSALLMLLANIFYESYIAYYLLVLTAILYHHLKRKDRDKKESWKQIFKDLLPFVFAGVLYLGTYVIYYYLHTSSYGGNSLMKTFSFQRIFDTFSTLFLNSFPLSPYFIYRDFISNHIDLFAYSDNYFVRCIHSLGFDAASFLKALLAVILWGVVMKHLRLSRRYRKAMIIMALLSLLLIATPHIPLSITEKYNYYHLNTYLSTSLSYYGVVMLFTMIFFLVSSLTRNRIIKITIHSVFGISLFLICLFTQSMSQHIANDMKRSRNRFELMEVVFNEDLMKENRATYVGSLHNPGTYFCNGVTRQSNLIGAYVEKVNGFRMNQYVDYSTFYQENKENCRSVYVAYFQQRPTTGEAFLAVAQLDGVNLHPNMDSLVCEKIIIGYYPSKHNNANKPKAWVLNEANMRPSMIRFEEVRDQYFDKTGLIQHVNY